MARWQPVIRPRYDFDSARQPTGGLIKVKMRLFCLAWALSVGMGCSIGAKPQGAPLKPESVTKILLRIPPENLAAGAVAQPENLATRIGKNLGGWGYPVVTDAAGAYSHVMEATVSGVEKKSTPPGFSFSAGNTDPRAVDFQQADVVTVTCTLRSKERRGESAYLKEEFVVENIFKSGGHSKNDPALFEAYVDHIGTACFNLLSELKVKRSQPALSESAGSSAAWFPEVSIEVREKPARPASGPVVPSAPAVKPSLPPAEPAAEPAAPVARTAEPSPKTTPIPPATPLPASEDSAGRPEPKPEAPSIRTETQQGQDRKQIVIHNHGNPIILEFGYERR